MNSKNMNTSLAAGISLMISVLIFVTIYFAAPFMVPTYMFETSAYYLIAIFIELIPLGIGVITFLVLTRQNVSDIFIFSKPQAKMNKDKMFWLIVLGAIAAIVGNYFVRMLSVGWLSLLEAVGYNVSDATLPAIENIEVFIIAIISIAVVPAIFEEMIFRGILQKGLLRNAKPVNAIIVSSVLFMLMHLSVENLPFTFVMGCVLGYLAYRTGSIIPSIMLHFVNNSIAVISLYIYELQKASNPLLEEMAELSDFSSAEILMAVVVAIISAALLLLVIWGYKKLSKAPPENPYLQPMKPAPVAVIVLTACILAFVTAFIGILQNIMPV